MSSSPSIISLLTFVAQQVSTYFGIFILVVGVIGDLFNLIVFLSLKTFRQSSCAFYLTIMTCVNIGQLLTGQLSRMMITGFNIDWTQTSLIYCKLRWYCLQACSLISLSCICFATIDQYLATSSYRRWQQWSNIKLAYYLCTSSFIFAILHGIPSIIYYNYTISLVTGKASCTITNSDYQKYRTYGFFICMTGFLPIFIIVLFGSLTYRNIQQLAYRTVPLVRRELDKQLTRMVLVQAIYGFFALMPYTTVIVITTSINSQNNPIFTAQLQLAESLSAVIFYSYFAAPFYIYVSVSKRFRQQLFYVLFRIYANCCRQHPLINNQISPETENN